MGQVCGATKKTKAMLENERIEAMLAADSKKNPVKMLLLGTGESGKSTVFKQLQLLHGKQFDDEDIAESVELVHKNVMENFIVLLTQFDAEPGQRITSMTEEIGAKKDEFLSKYDKDTPLTKGIAHEMKELWATERTCAKCVIRSMIMMGRI